MNCKYKPPYDAALGKYGDNSTPFAYYDIDTEDNLYTARSQAIDWYVHLEHHLLKALDWTRRDIKGAEDLSITQNKNIVTTRIDEAEEALKSHVTDAKVEIKNHTTNKATEVKTHVTSETNSAVSNINSSIENAKSNINSHTSSEVSSLWNQIKSWFRNQN